MVSIDDNKSSVLLDWDPSTSAMSQHDMQNYRYNVEYRVVGTDEHGSWIQSNHQPIGPGEFRYLGFVYLIQPINIVCIVLIYS